MNESGEPDAEILVRRYQRLLAWYPPRHRAAHGEEMLGVLLAAAPDGQRRPRIAEAANLLWGALVIWLRPRSAERPAGAWSDALAAFSVAAPVAFLTYFIVVLGFDTFGRYFVWSPGILVGLAFGGLGLALPFVLLSLRRTGAFVCGAAALLIAFATVRTLRTPGPEAFAMPFFCYATESAALLGSPGPRRGWTVVTAPGWLAIVAGSAAAGFLQHAVTIGWVRAENPRFVDWAGLGPLSQADWIAMSVVAAAILVLAVAAAARRSMLGRRVLLLFAIPAHTWLVTLAWHGVVTSAMVLPVSYIPPIVLGVLLVRAIRADRNSAPDADRPASA